MVREAVRECMTPLETLLRSTRSAFANTACASSAPDSAAWRTCRTALRKEARRWRLRARRLSDWRWRFLAWR